MSTEFNDDVIVGMVDVIFADVAQPDQARIVSLNASHFLKNQGHFVISIKVLLLPRYRGCLMRDSVVQAST